ncbi:MHF histone-fold complex subunit 1 [Ceratocystis fimbriata CBS 114723]|uniref:MHF histone-fold complex subunit 1 n=1 Tax=Ceratocystis fimbriata CBS 114723 TaxID=1035309 RepID=A0A2C5X6T3_9PEZI|nr:MHF histone-fold complex subunit 1 [Ceratocystis fimbriata CBS 114723]
MDDNETRQERLKTALWFAVGKIVDQELLPRQQNSTPQFIGALTEMVWTLLENTAIDLENFASHAGRSTVTTDDVLLLTRRNPDLQGIIKDFVEKERSEKAATKARSRS